MEPWRFRFRKLGGDKAKSKGLSPDLHRKLTPKTGERGKKEKKRQK